MREQSFAWRNIALLWGTVVLVTGLGAAVGRLGGVERPPEQRICPCVEGAAARAMPPLDRGASRRAPCAASVRRDPVGRCRRWAPRLVRCALRGVARLGAAVGSGGFEQMPEQAFAVVEGLAAGAMLTVITQTMMPEALHRSGGFVGLAALAGFLFTTALGA